MVKRPRVKITIMILFLFGLLLLTRCETGEAKTITVDDDGGADYNRILLAIKDAEVGDTIRVWNGTYLNTIVIDKNVTLVGNGTGNTFLEIDGNHNGFVIKDNGVTLTGFTILSNANEGASIKVEANNCAIYNNKCSGGKYGIRLENAHHNTVENNELRSERIGISIQDGSDHNSFQNNIISNYTEYGIFDGGFNKKNNIIASTNEINGIHPNHYYNMMGQVESPIIIDNYIDTLDHLKTTNFGFIFINNCT